MHSIHLKDISPADVQNYLQHAIAPRPICLASTIDKDGNVNLSPFSFFNLFSSNPPIVIFSPARRVRDNTTKHTLDNVTQVPEVVINMVDYNMVQQASLSSCEYTRGVSEFKKAGFTMQKAVLVKPPMVLESKIKLECLVNEVKPLGTNGGAGNLVICEVLQMHIAKEILNDDLKIDQRKINHVARLGGDWYCKIDAFNLFEVEKPNKHTGIGMDELPSAILHNAHFTKNNLAKLANVEKLPVVDSTYANKTLTDILASNKNTINTELYKYAAQLLDKDRVHDAWQILLRTILKTPTK